MKRRLVTLAAAASLVLCAATLVFGLWGFRESSDVRLEWVGAHRAVCVLSDRGAIAVIVSRGWPDARWAIDGLNQTVGTPTPLTVSNLILVDTTLERITVTDGTVVGTVTYRGVMTNVLYATLFTLIAPVAWLVRRARCRPEANRCPTCGYDLRATPNRCPECGGVPAAR